MKIRNIVVSIIFMGLGACASTTQLTKESENKLNKIALSKDVTVPAKAYYYGPEQGAGAVFGVIGAIVAEASTTKDELIVDYMKKNNIDIGKIALKEFERQIKLNPKFANKINSDENIDHDAKFVVEVRLYGISQTHGFSSVYRPTLGMAAKLVSTDGTVLWEEYEFLTAMNDGVEALPFDDYFKDPENMSKRFEKISENVVTQLMKSL